VTDPDGVEEVVRLCEYLPLAIRIAAARLRTRPAWTVGHFAGRLAEGERRLVELAAGDRSVAAAFTFSLACSATLASGTVQFVDGALAVCSWSLINPRLSVTTPGVWLVYLILLAAPILVLLPRVAPTASGAARDPAPSAPQTTGPLRAVGTVGLGPPRPSPAPR